MKNWTVIFKTIKNKQKGLFNYMKYLNNDTHQNHIKDGHEIIKILDKDYKDYFINLSNLIEEENIKKMIAGVGGRPNSKFGQSITLNLPFHLEEEEYKKVSDKILSSYFSQLNKMKGLKLTLEDFKHLKDNFLYVNVHKQNTGSKTQFNFIFPETIKGVKLDFSEKKYSHLFKLVSNEVLREFGHDINNYEFDNKYKQSKKISNYKMGKIDKILTDFKDMYLDYKEQLKDFERDFNTINTYLRRTSKLITKDQELEALKVIGRLTKSFEKIDKNIKETTLKTDKLTQDIQKVKSKVKTEILETTKNKDIQGNKRLNNIFKNR